MYSPSKEYEDWCIDEEICSSKQIKCLKHHDQVQPNLLQKSTIVSAKPINVPCYSEQHLKGEELSWLHACSSLSANGGENI